jgi:hypothetical protein
MWWLALVFGALVALASLVVLVVDLCALGSFLLSFWREEQDGSAGASPSRPRGAGAAPVSAPPSPTPLPRNDHVERTH